MAKSQTRGVLELFGSSTQLPRAPWLTIIEQQRCPFTKTKCFKVRKSQPEISIGTCSVRYGLDGKEIVICPDRLLERNQVFTDCIHLLRLHEPGNEFHIVPEVSIPGGTVDYFLASVKKNKVKDFVAIEFQTLDTTGSVWPYRQRFLASQGIAVASGDVKSRKSFGMNWKMTAKTILVQLHHKLETLEHLNKHLTLVIQDHLLNYLHREFNFGHLTGVRAGDSLHIHSYQMNEVDGQYRIGLDTRLTTDAEGIAKCLGLQAETRIEVNVILAELEKKISANTLFTVGSPPLTSHGEMPAE